MHLLSMKCYYIFITYIVIFIIYIVIESCININESNICMI